MQGAVFSALGAPIMYVSPLIVKLFTSAAMECSVWTHMLSAHPLLSNYLFRKFFHLSSAADSSLLKSEVNLKRTRFHTPYIQYL